MSPELVFLLSCLHRPGTQAFDSRLDTDALAALAGFHGLGPWLPRWTNGAVGAPVYAVHARRNLGLLAAAAQVCANLGERGIPARVLKGPVLAQHLHGDFALRQSGDIDVLVRPEDAPAAIEALRQSGASMLVPLEWAPARTAARWNSELPFRLAGTGVELDLHWRLAPSHSPFQMSVEACFEGGQGTVAAGRRFAIPAPEPMLIFLVLHGTRHMWERLVWVQDLVRLIAVGVDWPRVWRLARAGGLESALRVALVLAVQLGGVTLPARIALQPGESKALQSVLARLQAGVIAEPGTAGLLRFQSLLTGPTATLRHLLGLALRPTEHDWRMVRLPQPFFPLYYPLRLARLAFAYASHLRPAGKEPLIASNPGSITRTLHL